MTKKTNTFCFKFTSNISLNEKIQNLYVLLRIKWVQITLVIRSTILHRGITVQQYERLIN